MKITHPSPSGRPEPLLPPAAVNQRLAKWERWLHLITGEVCELVYGRHVWFGLGEIIEANADLPKEHDLYGTLGYWYANSMAVGVRRHVEIRDDAVSLARLLREIIESQQVVAEARRRNQWGGNAATELEPFDEGTPSGWADDHLARITNSGKPIYAYVNTTVAHLTTSRRDATFAVLHEAVDVLLDALVAVRYVILGDRRDRDRWLKTMETWAWVGPLSVQWVTEDIRTTIIEPVDRSGVLTIRSGAKRSGEPRE